MAAAARAQPLQPIVTVVSDFEDDSVAIGISDVDNVLAADCRAYRASIPARGQRSLAVEIGATRAGSSVAVDLRLRVPLRLERASRVAAYVWLKNDQAQVSFRIRDASGRLFESEPRKVASLNRWERVETELKPDDLKAADKGAARLAWPIQIEGFRIGTQVIGGHTVYLDDLEVEHAVPPEQSVVGNLSFDRPTKIYQPGEPISAVVTLENLSRKTAGAVSVELAWVREGGAALRTQHRSGINLPAAGMDFRSRQPIDFSLSIDEPGLYRLIGRIRSLAWRGAAEFSTSIVVMPSNRDLSRGRSTFVGLRSNLLREPPADRALEIAVAREIGAHVLAIDVPWRLVQPKPDRFDFEELDSIISDIATRGMAPMISVTEPPEWLDGGDFAKRQETLVDALVRQYGQRVRHFQLADDPRNEAAAQQAARQTAETAQPGVLVLPPSRPLTAAAETASAAGTNGDASKSAGCFQRTEGDWLSIEPLLSELAQEAGGAARGCWLEHQASAVAGAGIAYDAEALFRHYVKAASIGAEGLIWFDLRDDGVDPARPDEMRGLVRRDFSPKNSLIGFAAAARALTGARYADPVFGAPEEFDSGYLITADRHLAVLLPRGNRTRPAVLAPFAAVPGELGIADYLGSRQNVLRTPAGPLVQPLGRPFAVALALLNADPEPQLGFAKPWLKLPSRVYMSSGPKSTDADRAAAAEASLTLELKVPIPLRASFVRVIVPDGVPLTSNISARAITAPANEIAEQEIVLTAAGDRFDRATVTIDLSLEGQRVALPVEVIRPLPLKRRRLAQNVAVPDFKLLDLGSEQSTANLEIFGGYQLDQLALAIRIKDDAFIPFDTWAGRGDALLLGVAIEGHDSHAEVRLNLSESPTEARAPNSSAAGRASSPGLQTEAMGGARTDAAPDRMLVPIHGTPSSFVENWRVKAESAPDERLIHVTIPASCFGTDRLPDGTLARIALRYIDDDGSALREEHAWGGGLDGTRSTGVFAVLRFAGRSD